MLTVNRLPIQISPYPAGKRFAFTIVDDTDMATLESVRPVYDFLANLGLRTTKTVWVTPPDEPPDSIMDTGDTLARREYANYMRLLRDRGFELALHNVSSRSNTRRSIESGLECFGRILNELPRMNVHHQKNRENLYFDFAQTGVEQPSIFHTRALRTLHSGLRRRRRPAQALPHSCCGEDPRSEYFWGDICKSTITYIRTNVFYRDLNTLKCSPLMPYRSAETPFVNYWFDSSNGQDVTSFNTALSDENVGRLKKERGCSILYTHFGMGFVGEVNGRPTVLNDETARRLEAVAGDSDGWYVPVGTILDRLLAFQEVRVLGIRQGIAILNGGGAAIDSFTLHTASGESYCDLGTGDVWVADPRGLIILPRVPARSCIILARVSDATAARAWHDPGTHLLRTDLQILLERLGARWRHRD
jgi:hypothetical protein